MAKDKKTKNPPVEAPVVEKKKEEQLPAEQPAKVMTPGVPDGLNQHDKVLYASVIQHRKDEMIRTGGESAEKYNALTILEDATIIDIAVTELVIKKNPSALILTSNEKNYSAIQLLAADMGVTLPDFKSLPKPTKEQLKAVGLDAVPGQVVLKLEEKNVSKEAKEQKKKEQKTIDESKDKEYTKDHTKIETDEQLKEALGFQLVNPAVTNPIDRLITTAQFYRAYLEARSDKAENQNAELERIHALTNTDLLQDIITMVEPTFVTAGFGKMLCVSAETSKSVVSAFNMFKRACFDKKQKKYKYSDEEIAAFVRILIVWYATSKIANLGKDIKALSKDAKANAKAIDGCNNGIKHFQWMISLTTEPDFDIIDGMVDAYNDKENACHKQAEALVKSVIETYYKDNDVNDLTKPVIVLNAKQYAGVTLNLFRDPLTRRDDFSLENLIALPESEKVEEPEEKATEEEPKNA